MNPKKNFQPVWVTGKDKDEVGSRGNTGAIQKHRKAGENSERAKKKSEKTERKKEDEERMEKRANQKQKEQEKLTAGGGGGGRVETDGKEN